MACALLNEAQRNTGRVHQRHPSSPKVLGRNLLHPGFCRLTLQIAANVSEAWHVPVGVGDNQVIIDVVLVLALTLQLALPMQFQR